jgi:hypothetical protein
MFSLSTFLISLLSYLLLTGRYRVQFPMRSLDFSNWNNPSSLTMALGSIQPLTEMSTGNLPGGKGRPTCKAENLTAVCEPIVEKMLELRRLTNVWASTACYRDSFTFLPTYIRRYLLVQFIIFLHVNFSLIIIIFTYFISSLPYFGTM